MNNDELLTDNSWWHKLSRTSVYI